MAKRTRGSSRPGQRRSVQRAPARPQRPAERVATRAPQGLSDEEEARAAELEAQIVAQERAAEQGRSRQRTKRDEFERAPRPAGRAGASLLAVKAAEEYAYVVRDVRRILEVGGAMLALMVVAYVVLNVTHAV